MRRQRLLEQINRFSYVVPVSAGSYTEQKGGTEGKSKDMDNRRRNSPPQSGKLNAEHREKTKDNKQTRKQAGKEAEQIKGQARAAQAEAEEHKEKTTEKKQAKRQKKQKSKPERQQYRQKKDSPGI